MCEWDGPTSAGAACVGLVDMTVGRVGAVVIPLESDGPQSRLGRRRGHGSTGASVGAVDIAGKTPRPLSARAGGWMCYGESAVPAVCACSCVSRLWLCVSVSARFAPTDPVISTGGPYW